MIKKMRRKEREEGKRRRNMPPYVFSIKRHIPCIIGGENEHNLILSMREGRCEGKGKA